MLLLNPWNNESLAPNGQPVRENFSRWFADSKIVDRDGHPLVLYRGDPKPIDCFDSSSRREPGQFFCIERERAAYYGEPSAYVLHATNPLDLREVYGQWRKGGPVRELVESLFSEHYENEHNNETGEPYSVGDVITAIEEGFLWKMDGLGGWKMNAWRDLQHQAQAMGFDAIVVHDDGEGWGKGVDYIVFEATQIKSIERNCGLFLKDSTSVSDKEAGIVLEQGLRAMASIQEGSMFEKLAP